MATPPTDRPVLRRSIRLHQAQADFRHSPALYRGFVGGRSSGKSWVGAYDLIRRALPAATYLVASPTYTVLDDTTLPTFTALAKGLGVYRDTKMTPRPTVRLARDVHVRFRSAEEPDKLRGPNLSGAWLDEASLMGEEAYTVVIGALREGGRQGWLSATFTPKGTAHWTYDVFGRGRPDTALFRAHTRDNPFNPPDFADTLARQYGPLRARQELAGDFTAGAGRHFDTSAWPRYRFHPADRNAVLLPGDVPLPLADCDVFAVMDPSTGKAAAAGGGDYNAIGVAALTPAQDLLILDVSRKRLPTSQVVGELARVCRRWRPWFVAVEANGFQVFVAAAAADTPGVAPVREVTPEGKSKLARAQPAMIRADRGKVLLPERGEPAAPWLDDFESEITFFTGDPKLDASDDQLDVLAYLALCVDRYNMVGEEGEPVAGPPRAW
jgi:predicted phage terminase large subunit-like protein